MASLSSPASDFAYRRSLVFFNKRLGCQAAGFLSFSFPIIFHISEIFQVIAFPGLFNLSARPAIDFSAHRSQLLWTY